ncbi:MAG: BTAD domain-containing putative transcriptional regulator, partial [Anaerolineales bacterium]
FEVSLRDANALGRTDAERSELLRRAIDLYQADFLVGIESDWVIRRREQLRLKYVHALTDLGDWERSHRRRVAAMRLYRRAIEVEAFHEPAHAGIMNCYAEDGLPRQAITHFRELEADLVRELSTKPSPEIVALYEHIAAGV